MTLSKFTILCTNPLVAFCDNFVDAAFCDHVISLAETVGKSRAQVVDTKKGGSKESDTRTNTNVTLNTWTDPKLTDYAQSVSEIVRLPPENSEPASLLHYVEDQEFKPHADAFDMSTGGKVARASGGQRLFTTICYLNDVPEGGETEFPDLKISVRPRQGRLLVFGNTLLGTAEAHPHSTHAGRPCPGHEKYALTLWWRQITYQNHRSYPAETTEIQFY